MPWDHAEAQGVWPNGASVSKHTRGAGDPNMVHRMQAMPRTQHAHKAELTWR